MDGTECTPIQSNVGMNSLFDTEDREREQDRLLDLFPNARCHRFQVTRVTCIFQSCKFCDAVETVEIEGVTR